MTLIGRRRVRVHRPVDVDGGNRTRHLHESVGRRAGVEGAAAGAAVGHAGGGSGVTRVCTGLTRMTMRTVLCTTTVARLTMCDAEIGFMVGHGFTLPLT